MAKATEMAAESAAELAPCRGIDNRIGISLVCRGNLRRGGTRKVCRQFLAAARPRGQVMKGLLREDRGAVEPEQKSQCRRVVPALDEPVVEARKQRFAH